jgi:NADP-dependent 3-hydroxy acid dehydrogenase YdfG
MTTLSGKIAWVTGGGGGIGEAGAKALAEAGAHVVISGRRADALDRVAAEIAAAGGSAEALTLDVCDAAAVMAAAADIEARHGAVDIHLANAGTNIPNRSSATVTPQDFAAVVDVNLNGVMNGTLAVLPGMRAKGGGTIIMISSWAGRHGSAMTGPAYNASKHAVVALSHSINIEEAVNNIRCTVVMPGEVATSILDRRPVPPSAKARARMLQPEDLGRVIRFVAEQPPHVNMNEVLISPTWNRGFVGFSGD